ncbi:Clp protease N-terminal domain-containing protein [Paractinoplanes hotanensis]|uniref:Clp protease N-terminal domain-containing protein n=1 Tax=Paractinoplanes hotanensis TaxID=2906497 RepID=A0ABT0XRA2_9ACTN|nr:Clp protease N-terminal domain-containing protein [Actinoplanes hotanensis]MCM4076301.1 Clp protease N-terminal domain-containing protein [Actinoplanes hotanensis]
MEIMIGDKLTHTLGRARGAADGPIGTGPLLFSLAYDKGVKPLLDAFDISSTVILTVLRTPGRPSAEPDAGRVIEPDAGPVLGPSGEHAHVRGTDGRSLPVSAAAADALREAQDSPAALLAALVDDPAAEASAVIRDCGVNPDEVRQAALDGHRPQRADRVAPELRPARDALLGRTRYRGRGFQDRLLFSVLARKVNHAARPVLWTRLEADEQARRENRPTRTDDVLLAMLVTHEVAAAYPHLAYAAQPHYGGGETLLAQGITHTRVRAATPTGPDEVPPSKILVPGPDWTEDTQVLLDRLTAHPGNRATRLLDSLRR